MKTIHKELRKHPIAQLFTGPEFSPRSSNRIIRGIVDLIRNYSRSETSADIRKTGSRITFAQVLSADNSITARIMYSSSYAPINFHMMNDLVPAQIDVEINYNPAVNKTYQILARKI